MITWLVFAIYYFFLCFLHGDLDPELRGENSTWTPCVENVNSFTEAYLFSIETMSTIGEIRFRDRIIQSTAESNLRLRLACPLLHEMSYIPPLFFVIRVRVAVPDGGVPWGLPGRDAAVSDRCRSAVRSGIAGRVQDTARQNTVTDHSLQQHRT